MELKDLLVSYNLILPDNDNIIYEADKPQLFNTNFSRVKSLFNEEESNTNEDPVFNWKYEPKSNITKSSNIETVNDSISENMFLNLLQIEGKSDLTAHVLKNNFGETFATGPYGLVYKYDSNGNITGKFKEGEKMTEDEAVENARRSYKKRADKWKQLLSGKQGLTLNRLDALVSASGGTSESRKALQKFVIMNWGDWNSISNYIRNFSITSAGNGKKLPGLVIRRLMEADIFEGKLNGNWRDYQHRRKQYGV